MKSRLTQPESVLEYRRIQRLAKKLGSKLTIDEDGSGHCFVIDGFIFHYLQEVDAYLVGKAMKEFPV